MLTIINWQLILSICCKVKFENRNFDMSPIHAGPVHSNCCQWFGGWTAISRRLNAAAKYLGHILKRPQERHRMQHERFGELLWQCRRWELLLVTQTGASEPCSLPNPRGGPCRSIRVHRGVLQPKATPWLPWQREPGRLRRAVSRIFWNRPLNWGKTIRPQVVVH